MKQQQLQHIFIYVCLCVYVYMDTCMRVCVGVCECVCVTSKSFLRHVHLTKQKK